MIGKRFLGIPIALFGIAFFAIVGLVILGLWNQLMPAIFGLRAITFWQALGLFLLSRTLFGGFGGRGRGMRRARFARGWSSLTPEERQRFRDAMGRHCPERFREDETTGKA